MWGEAELRGKPYLTQNLYHGGPPSGSYVWFGESHWLATRVSSRFLWAKSLCIRDDVLYFGIFTNGNNKNNVLCIERLLVLDILLSIL